MNICTSFNLNTKLLGFEYVKDLYVEDIDFGQVYVACEHSVFDKFYRVMNIYLKKKIRCAELFYV